MKIAGVIAIIASVIIAAIFALQPAEVSALGTSVSCGQPISTVAGGVAAKPEAREGWAVQECLSRSLDRLTIGAVVLIVGVGGGLIMAFILGARRPASYYWDGQRWQPMPPQA